MKNKYVVYGFIRQVYTIEVEAENTREAKELASNISLSDWKEGTNDWVDWDVEEVNDH